MARATALLALLVLSACREDPQATLLAGNWLCASEPHDYAMERQVSFAEGGKLSGRSEVESSDDRTPVAMQFSFSGSWEVEDGTLTEWLDTHRLMRFSRDGANVPLAELPSGMITEVETTLAGQSAAYRIESLTAEALALRDTVEDVQTVCEREPEQESE
ncbi:hypothetical protein [Oceanicola sp. 502str15]|uniref:hypothetical protein n=1 Tax=Oceanicola sp. 502str15 TaxID=2696061 RepID=UPI002094201A|nr:hypothetical protein [Oceanicola sp. 502str15]MCO6384239.1 hypothetical protein [Oceanicola sp. 502str15]